MYKKKLNEEYIRKLMKVFEQILFDNSEEDAYLSRRSYRRQEFRYKLLDIDYTRYS